MSSSKFLSLLAVLALAACASPNASAPPPAWAGLPPGSVYGCLANGEVSFVNTGTCWVDVPGLAGSYTYTARR